MHPTIPALALAPLLALAGCASSLPVPGLGTAEVTTLRSEAPPGAPEGSCWGRDFTPAVIETVTEHVQVPGQTSGDEAGAAAPVSYRTETRQTIVRERQQVWFRTPCPEELTEEFIASLQRALAARNLYAGAVTGAMDPATHAAIRAYQRPRGLDSGVLSLAAARKMGLSTLGEAPEPLLGDEIPVLPIAG